VTAAQLAVVLAADPAWTVAGLAAGAMLLILALTVAWLWTRPGLLSALTAGAVLSLLVIVPWAFIADLAAGPSGPLDLTARDIGGSYARLAGGPTGNPAELITVAGVITGLCLLAGFRRRERRGSTVPARHAAPAADVDVRGRGPRPAGVTAVRGRHGHAQG